MSMFRPYDPSMGITQDQYQQQQVAFNKRMYGEGSSPWYGGLSSLSGRVPGSAGPMKRLEDYRPRQTPWGQKGITKQQWHENNPGVNWFPSEDPNRPRFDFFGDPNFIPEGWPPTGGPNLGTGNGTMLGGPPQGFTPPTGPATMAVVPYINPSTGEKWTAPSGGYTAPEGWEVDKQNGRPEIELPYSDIDKWMPEYPDEPIPPRPPSVMPTPQPPVMPPQPPVMPLPQPPVMPSPIPQPPVTPTPQPPVIPDWQRRRPGHEIQADLARARAASSVGIPPVSPTPQPQLPASTQMPTPYSPAPAPVFRPPAIQLRHGGSLTDSILNILRSLSKENSNGK